MLDILKTYARRGLLVAVGLLLGWLLSGSPAKVGLLGLDAEIPIGTTTVASKPQACNPQAPLAAATAAGTVSTAQCAADIRKAKEEGDTLASVERVSCDARVREAEDKAALRCPKPAAEVRTERVETPATATSCAAFMQQAAAKAKAACPKPAAVAPKAEAPALAPTPKPAQPPMAVGAGTAWVAVGPLTAKAEWTNPRTGERKLCNGWSIDGLLCTHDAAFVACVSALSGQLQAARMGDGVAHVRSSNSAHPCVFGTKK
ncbi:MAG: hypothetical protein WAX89_07485 [Alphaproteobacteria bacterium]